MIVYRYLTGNDDATFCHRVTMELSRGWQLHGQPTIAYDAAKQAIICGQVVTKDVDGLTYSADLDLSAL